MNFTLIRNIIKKTLGLIYLLIPNVHKKIRSGLTVFVFHDVTDTPSQFSNAYNIAISSQTFKYQINWIKSNFNIIHPSTVIESKTIPKGSALITFDDGFLGSFENGLSILEDMNVPSILFLNMQAIVKEKPILSAVACYLDQFSPEFQKFSKENSFVKAAHLELTPSNFNKFENQYGAVDWSRVIEYQGEFANIDTLKKWDNKPLVAFGNHLYDHWNAASLSQDELEEQYTKNESELSKLNNSINLFAFTNGQPGICFSERDIKLLKNLNAEKLFSAVGGVNSDPKKLLLGRISLFDTDNTKLNLWHRLGKAALSSH